MNQDQSTNFQFLETEFPILYSLTLGAEYNLYQDPVVSLVKLRQFVEKLSDTLFNEHYLEFPEPNTVAKRIKELEYEGILPDQVRDLLFNVNRKGNVAAHQIKGGTQDALSSLHSTFKVAKWLYSVYGSGTHDVDTQRFHKPEDKDARHAIHILEEDYKALEEKFNKLLSERSTEGLPKEKEAAIIVKAHKEASKITMNEAETRKLIDAQLRSFGWEADTEEINYKTKKTQPERGKNKAISEWRVGSKWADYALFIGLELYGIIEAKKYSTDISSDLSQAKVYGKLAVEGNEVKLLGEWRDYKVPFLFTTNGRKYLEQLKTKSGIWFLDVRKPTNVARSIKGWYTPDGLKKIYEQDIDAAEQKLKDGSYEYLQSKGGLGLRDYQIKAILAIEKQLIEQPEKERLLLAMATGTGKTRTSIGLCYRLISSNRFNRILFLVDRRLLAKQAYDSFKDNKIIDANTFGSIYEMKGLKDMAPDINTRLHFATVQSMVKRLFYAAEDKDAISVDQYDCVIVDEAHRGYLLDKELDDEEINFKNQDDYVSQYRKVVDYFDGYTIGLTATPALHTIDIFGKPVFSYGYREAVIDGHLIDHDAPIPIRTELSENGMVWETGTKPKAYDAEKNEIIELDELEDELKIEIEGFNKLVITESFNRVVVKELVKHLDPDGEEKTLIFATRDSHADLIVQYLIEEFNEIGAEVDQEAILKITGKHYNTEEALRKFKNEKYPNIVVTVDLLTTGIDVPTISNLVFLRRVRSRILYEQMIGRATRKCDEIGKTIFKIYDAVRLYEALADYTQMKPVTVNPTTTFSELAGEMDQISSDERAVQQVEQIIAKLHRKKGLVVGEELEKWERDSGTETPAEFINMLRALTGSEAKTEINKYDKLWNYLDQLKPVKKYQMISEHDDALIANDPNVVYGSYKKPEDYITGFQVFIEENKEKIAALKLVMTSPRELDRKSLKELRLILHENGFKSRLLDKAWKDVKNQDIAADIISYIRTLTMGSDLIDHETRIKKAMTVIRDQRSWNAIQKKWLDRFEINLLEESILQKGDLDKGAFKDHGGYNKLNRIFEDQLDEIIETINTNLYKDIA